MQMAKASRAGRGGWERVRWHRGTKPRPLASSLLLLSQNPRGWGCVAPGVEIKRQGRRHVEVRGETPAFPGLADLEERAEPVLGKGAGSPARFVCQTTPGKAPGRGNRGTPLPRPPAPPGPARGGQGPTGTRVPRGIPPLPTPAPAASL